MHDFQTMLAVGLPTDYHVEDTWTNYDRLAARITDRFNDSIETSKSKPWWKVGLNLLHPSAFGAG